VSGWIQVLPDGWAEAPIKRLGDVTLGKMLQSSANSASDVHAPYMRAANVQPDGMLALDDAQRMWFVPDELRSLKLKRGVVVVVEGGVGGYGRAAYLDHDLEGWGFQNSINRIIPAGDHDGRFVAYCLIAARQLGWIAAYCNVVSMPHLTAEKLEALHVPMPPPGRQAAIADHLDDETAKIDKLITKQQHLIERLRERRRSLVSEVVLGRDQAVARRPSAVDWIGEIPQHWAVRPLWSMYARQKNVGFPDEPMVSVYREYGVVFKDSRSDNLNQTAENRNIYQLIEPGWLVCNRMKAWQGSVGVSTIRGIVSGHYICFRPLHAEDSRYLNWLFRSDVYTTGYRMISRGVRPGQAEIDNDDYRVVPVVVPPLAEQRRIVAHLDAQTAKIDVLIAKTERFIALVRERRAALITAAVTGQIDVRTARQGVA
jgi:type I restriction enzyme, S subunit